MAAVSVTQTESSSGVKPAGYSLIADPFLPAIRFAWPITTSVPTLSGRALWLTIHSAVRGPQYTLTFGTITSKRRAAEITRLAQRDTRLFPGMCAAAVRRHARAEPPRTL